jgi:hypothetical protein
MTKDERNSTWQQGVFLRRTVKRLFLSCLSRYFGARLAGACFTGTGLAEAGLPKLVSFSNYELAPVLNAGQALDCSFLRVFYLVPKNR